MKARSREDAGRRAREPGPRCWMLACFARGRARADAVLSRRPGGTFVCMCVCVCVCARARVRVRVYVCVCVCASMNV